MEPFIALGLKGADKVIDKHFHKIPDKYVHADTYKPKVLTKNKQSRRSSKDAEFGAGAGAAGGTALSERNLDRHNRSDQESEAGSGQEYEVEEPQTREEKMMQDSPRYTTGGAGLPDTRDSPFGIPPQYSHEPPRTRPEYMPSPPSQFSQPRRQEPYFPPPPVQPYYTPLDHERERDSRRGRGRRNSWDDDGDYYSDSYHHAPRRPKAVTRRSSSYHGRGYRDHSPDHRSGYGDQQVARRSTGSHTVDKARDTAHRYGLKDEVEGVFTSSKVGLTGGAVGALVGGWASQKAQVAYSPKGRGRDKSPNALITLLGAAVGGLAANAVVDKWEDGKKETDKKERKWDEKWDEPDGRSEAGKSSKSGGGRSHRSTRDRERRDSRAYGGDGYD